jgi:hypothetical protein
MGSAPNETPHHHTQGEQQAAEEAHAPAAAAYVSVDAERRAGLRRPHALAAPSEVDHVKHDARPPPWRPHKRRPLQPLHRRKPIVVVPLPHHREEDLTPQTTRAALAHFSWMLLWRRV